jgi:hypothetical protein
MRALALLIMLVALTVGCASVSYTEPADGPRTRVRFAVGEEAVPTGLPLESENAVVYGFADANCSDGREWMALLNGFLVNSDPRSLGMPLADYHRNAAKEFYVSTAQPMTIMFIGGASSFNGVTTTDYYCPVLVSVPLTTGTDYEFVYRPFGNTRCAVEMNELVSGEAGPERHLVRRFENVLRGVPAGCIEFFNRVR